MVYVTQYDFWWSFTDRQWRDFCRSAISGIRSGAGYELPDENMLKTRPRYVARESRRSRWWYATKNGIEVVQPLDWTLEEWEEKLEDSQHKALTHPC